MLQHSRSLQPASTAGNSAKPGTAAAAAAAAVAADDSANCEQDEEEWRSVLEEGSWPFQRLCDQVSGIDEKKSGHALQRTMVFALCQLVLHFQLKPGI